MVGDGLMLRWIVPGIAISSAKSGPAVKVRKMKQASRLYIAALSAAVVVAGGIHSSAYFLDVPVKILTRDPYRAAEVPPYFAYFSLVGSTIWLIASAATLATGVAAWRIFRCRLTDRSVFRIVALGGAIGLLMALDDILLSPGVGASALGFPEILFHLFYFFSIVSMTFFCRVVLRSTPWVILLAALVCFGLSSVIDVWRSLPEALGQSEDVFKICGVVLWAFYFLYVSWTLIDGGVETAAEAG